MGVKQTRRLRAGMLAVALAAASSVGSPALVIGGVDGPAPSQFLQPHTRVPLAARPVGMQREVFGFFRTVHRKLMLHADYSVLSIVSYFAVKARGNGHIKRGTDYDWQGWSGDTTDRVIDKAHAAGTRFLLTVGRFSWTSSTYATSVQLLQRREYRQRLADELAAQVVARGIDGVTLDFEPIPGSQRENFVKLVGQVRHALDARRFGYYLAVAATGFVANYDVAGIVDAGANAIFIMAYHYNGAWSNHSGGISPLHRHSYDVQDTIDAFRAAGAPASKIILGLPYYGYVWSTRTNANHAKTWPASSARGWPFSVTYDTAMRLAATYGRRWDGIESAPWTRWLFRNCGSCPLTWREMYYDDVVSYGLKFDLVNDRNLQGVGMWALGYEGGRTELNDLLRQKFGSH